MWDHQEIGHVLNLIVTCLEPGPSEIEPTQTMIENSGVCREIGVTESDRQEVASGYYPISDFDVNYTTSWNPAGDNQSEALMTSYLGQEA